MPTMSPPSACDQAGRGRGGAAGGEHVVDDEDPLVGVDGVAVDLQLVVPYSSSYSSRATAHGSLPALRTGTNPAPMR